jgi:pyruvate decarboxylase
VLLARKEMQQPGRVILLVGDGSLQLTVQEIGTMIRQGFTPTIFLINNAGYTIERAIHGPGESYNDISTRWDYQKMLSFFGARNPGNYTAKTFSELDHVLQSEQFKRSDRIQLLELFFEKMDSPWRLLRQIEIMSARAQGQGEMKRDAIV